jgi:hypothetical protein
MRVRDAGSAGRDRERPGEAPAGEVDQPRKDVPGDQAEDEAALKAVMGRALSRRRTVWRGRPWAAWGSA